MPLSEILDKMADATESLMDSARPSDETVACPLCGLKVTEAADHDSMCGYRIARTGLSPHDVKTVRQLARIMRGEI